MSSNVGSAQSPAVESWDDDFQNEGDAPFTSNFGHALSSAKQSLSSRLSTRSASNAGDDDWELPIDSSKSSSATDAISSAKEAGIPIPSNVPSSALLGGAIKRLGGKRRQAKHVYDDWAEDLDLPTDPSAPLQLKPLAAASTTAALDDDFDDSWAEGSLGVRFAGTRRDSKNRSSSASAMSPSLASNLTMESEDDTMTGLVLPPGPLDFTIALKRRQAEQAAAEPSSPSALDSPLEPSSATTRPFSGQQEGDDDDFFADLDIGNGDLVDPRKRKLHLNVKSNANKFPKSSGAVPKTQTSITFTERATTRIPRPVSLTKPHRLEPVLEAGATTSSSRPRRLEPTTTSAQLLRAKRSMPALRATPPVLNKAPSVPSLISGHAHPLAANRPLHLHTRRESDGLRPRSPTIRSHSRMSSMGAPPDTPTRSRRDVAPATLAREAAAKRTITKPVARKHFGNGTELDNLDDLPTSATKENRYVKQPITRAPATKPIRSQNSQSRLGMRDKSCTPQPSLTPFSSTSQENLPRFARDTAASRIAREQTLAQPARARGDAPLAPKTNWAAQVAARSPYNSPQSKRTVRRMPNLINPMGKENIHHFQDDAVKKGMRWNSISMRWEGNDAALAGFGSARQTSPPRPALISNMAGKHQGVQVNGGMVFDPQRMCWLKMAASGSDARSASIDDDDDPFKDIADLADERSRRDTAVRATGVSGSGEWLIGEEFDLGPEFIRRQREEEIRWREQVDAWFSDGALGPQQQGQASLRELRALAATLFVL